MCVKKKFKKKNKLDIYITFVGKFKLKLNN